MTADNAPRLSVGSIFGRTYAMLKQNPGLYLGLSLLAAIPSILLGGSSSRAESGFPTQYVSSIVIMIFNGAIAYGVYQGMVGKRVGITEAMAKGMSRIGALILISILVGLGTVIGYLCFIIPGIILGVMWSVTVQSCVVEKRGALDSMNRSASLTKGYRWQIFGLNLLIGILLFGTTFLITFFTGIFTGDSRTSVMMGGLFMVLPQAFNSVMTALIYCDLRIIKEGLTVEKLVDVFD